MTVAVIADSAASLSPGLAASRLIGVVPLQVVVDGEARPEGVDIGHAEVVAHLRAGDVVTTSQPTPAAFDEAIAAAVAEGADGVVIVAMSGALSGTYEAAVAAAARADLPVEVVDTRTVAMATGYAALAAAHAARAGGSLADVAAAARAVATGSRCFFTVESLDHLRRGGRIGPAVAAVGRVLGIRPVLEVRDGEVVLVGRVRSAARARAALHAAVDDALGGRAHPVVTVHGVGAEESAGEAAREIEARHPWLGPVAVAEVSAVLSAHAGPGTLAAVVADLPPEA
ncbi:DegV family protein [Demequina sp. SYSU T00192]|uniref:DegV family protein n=1 Tax=Demequina litoralis TaxID=3051660 RepID=A0ABT8GBK1_9MICO|nr:DegV family protein [Demequina sp. SYSU T00192]MDN4476516.1 DegV family protein [Demequina sp. SYSU T00192]